MRSCVLPAALCALAAAAVQVPSSGPAAGQTAAGQAAGTQAQAVPDGSEPDGSAAGQRATLKGEEKARSERVLRDLDRRAKDSAEAGRRFEGELERLRTDGAALSAALVAAAARAQDIETRIKAAEERLATLAGSEEALRGSLARRRDLVADVLAALQRIGRRAAPAALVRPEDILAAVRSSMLLGAVVPGLREEVEALAADLAELVRLRALAASDRLVLDRELRLLDEERGRLGSLVQLRRTQIAATEASLTAERARSALLGREARTVKDLVDRLGQEANEARQEAEGERRRSDAELRQMRERFAAAAGRDPVRLAPKVRFADARGSLGRPAAGPVMRDFGAPDGLGGTMRGIVIGARPKAVVTSPCDGWISFAGPFRSFGRLLIINAGDGYYLLLAGLDQINVETGQFVLSGEPVGQMGETTSPSAAMGAVEGSGPALYVEFRKDGGSIDPRLWGAKSWGERVRG